MTGKAGELVNMMCKVDQLWSEQEEGRMNLYMWNMCANEKNLVEARLECQEKCQQEQHIFEVQPGRPD